MSDDLEPLRTEHPNDLTVNYVFPVEVIVVGGLSVDDHALIQARIWDDFGEALDRQV